jgi:hypothetical protein
MGKKRRPAAPVASSSGLDGIHFLDTLASIPINETTAATSGVLRATFDSISADADVARARAAARARGPEALAEFTAAAGRLAQRTGEYYASLK